MNTIRIVLIACLFVAGCATPTPPMLTLMLDVDRVANGGRALRVVVEMVDEESFASASYQSVVGRALHLDSPVLLSRMVFPGSQERLEFAEPSGGLIGIYVLFTQPGEGQWKRLVHPPFPDEIHLRLMENEVESVSPPGFFDRLVFW